MRVFAAALILAGCAAVGPDYQPPETPQPDDWSSWHGGSAELVGSARTQVQAPLTAGFALLQDPVLEKLQAQALTTNSDLQGALLRFAQSRTMRAASAAQDQPALALKAGVGRQRQSESGAATRMVDAIVPPQGRQPLIDILSSPFTLYQAGFDASWEPDFWGKIRRDVEAADANIDMAQADLQQVQLIVLTEVARNYFELRGSQNQLRLLRADIARSQTLLALMKARTQGGVTAAIDLQQQQIQLDELQARMPLLLARESQLLNQLSLLLGQQPGSLQTELAMDSEWHLPNLPDLSLGLPSELAHRRPDIRASEAQLHAATANIGIARAQLYPQITLGASFGFESVDSDKFGDWGSRQWSLGPNFYLPIFDRGRLHTQVQLRELQQQQAAVAYQHTVLKAWHDIDNSLSSYTAAQLQHQQLAAKLTHSQDLLALAQVNYQQGLTNYMVQLQAEQAYAQAERDYSDSSVNLAVMLVSIFKALGGPLPTATSEQR